MNACFIINFTQAVVVNHFFLDLKAQQKKKNISMFKYLFRPILLVFQSQQSNNLPNGVLFQVKVAYAYTPVHDDELSIKPNDIINVTRLVRLFSSELLFDRRSMII